MSGVNLVAGQWTWHTPQETVDKDGVILATSFLVELGGRTALNFEIRCEDGVSVNAVDRQGQRLFIGKGTVVRFSGRVKGFVGLEIVSSSTFAFCSDIRSRWIERPDPNPLQVGMQQPVDPMRQMLKEELRKYVGRMQAAQMFASDVDVAELLDDIENGDLDFDEEPDPFGAGHMEAEMALEAAPEPQEKPKAKKAPSSPAKQKDAPASPTPPPAADPEPDGS